MPTEYPPQYLEAIQLFNQEDFFECHDVLEELWSETIGPEKQFLQGLIQAAVALFHFGNENLGGARKLYQASQEKLAPFAPRYWGLDVETFLAGMKYCFQELLDARDTWPKGVELCDERVPRITLLPE